MAASCLLCEKDLVKRRPIHSAANKHVLPVLEEIARELFGELSVASTLSPPAALCHPCLRNVEKLVKMKSDLQKKMKEIGEQIGKAVERCEAGRGTTAHARTVDIRTAGVASAAGTGSAGITEVGTSGVGTGSDATAEGDVETMSGSDVRFTETRMEVEPSMRGESETTPTTPCRMRGSSGQRRRPISSRTPFGRRGSPLCSPRSRRASAARFQMENRRTVKLSPVHRALSHLNPSASSPGLAVSNIIIPLM